MNKILILLISTVFPTVVSGQEVSIKSNLLYDATTTLNLGVEVALSEKLTLDVSGNYNPWEFKDNKKWKHWLIQPELRYWLRESFKGHFFGVHAHYAGFNVGNIKLFSALKDRHYQGNLYGGGISYGYQWALKNRWSMEATIGVGYAHIDYDQYKNCSCDTKLGSGHKNYVGLTKIGLSLIYTLK